MFDQSIICLVVVLCMCFLLRLLDCFKGETLLFYIVLVSLLFSRFSFN